MEIQCAPSEEPLRVICRCQELELGGAEPTLVAVGSASVNPPRAILESERDRDALGAGSRRAPLGEGHTSVYFAAYSRCPKVISSPSALVLVLVAFFSLANLARVICAFQVQ